MDLSDIFRGLFVLFILVQVVTSFTKKSGKKGKAPRQIKQNPKQASNRQKSDFEARLEEARKRVREATSENSPSHKPQEHIGGERSDELFHGKQEPEHISMPSGFSKEVVVSQQTSLPQGMSGRMSQARTIQSTKHMTLPGGLSGHMGSSQHKTLPKGLSGHLDSPYYRPKAEVGLDELESHHSKHVKFKHHTKKVYIKKKKTVKLDSSVIHMDPDSIVSGIIWHQILSKPKYKQQRRN